MQIKIDNDGMLGIAVGRGRREMRWQNKRLKWSELLDRLSRTTYTMESVEEFKGHSKGEQDDIKDVGGFVGGALKGGRRRSEAVESRCLLTLDADFAETGLWEGIKNRFHFSCCIYSTHKHSPARPRFRIVVPLLRPVSSEEYQAISRLVASDIGIEIFDDTTHEPERLMYWPSTSRDGVFEFNYQDGSWLNPDEILGRYADWRDISKWPQSIRVPEERKKLGRKQGNPQEKKGMVGAFCRTYSIHGAIEKFLSAVYVPCEDKNRYTYIKGTTTGGLVVYEEGDFAYSHHGSDPAGGRLCNAFDLARIHRFGGQDLEAAEGTPVVKLPSYESMLNLSRGDDEVKLTLGKERVKSAAEGFDVLEEADEDDAEWMKQLEVDKRGSYKPTIGNVVLILENDPNLKKKIALSEFSHRIMKTGNLPWHRLVNKTQGDLWQDSDDASLRHYIERAYEISTPSRINDALSIIQEKNKYHPIRNYLKSLSWDGTKRVENLLIDYLGAEDSVYTRTVTRKMMAAAVARVFVPGIKFDHMLVLVGEQGLAKSQLIRLLGKFWYSDSVITIQGKEAYEQLQGVWILEMAELSATRRADVEHVKQYISKCEDSYRVAYGRYVAQFPRQCIFIGTTNENEFLRDKTGNRRFWPVVSRVEWIKKDLWKELTPMIVDQLWAEAYVIWENREELFLRDEVEKEAFIKQELHMENSMNEGIIREYMDMLLPENWDSMDLWERRRYIRGEEIGEKKKGEKVRDKICAMEIWRELMNGEAKELRKSTEIELHDILRRIEGWKPYTQGTGKLRFKIYGPQKAYIRDAAPKD